MSSEISLLPYFVASVVALSAVFGVLVWSGAVDFKPWTKLSGYAVVGDFDNVLGKSSQEDCFKDCSKAYVACVFTEGVPENYNCQLYRSVACGYKNRASTTKYNPRTVTNVPDEQPCIGSSTD